MVVSEEAETRREGLAGGKGWPGEGLANGEERGAGEVLGGGVIMSWLLMSRS